MHRWSWCASAALAACAGPDLPSISDGGGDGAASSAAVLATEIVDAPGATGSGFGDPSRATNGVRGGGPTQGSLDVYSLDYAERSHLVLGWSGARVTDGPGADLVVFENAFRYEGGHFMDPVIVSVSLDGETWVDLPHEYLADDPAIYSADPDDWIGFAGITPVLLHADTNAVDPFDRIAAGGDAFDLASLPEDDGEASLIRREGFRYLRLESAAARVNPATDARYPRDPTSGGADIDGVFARYLVTAP